MSIRSIGNNDLTSSLQANVKTQEVNPKASEIGQANQAQAAGRTASDSINLSKPAQLFSMLQQLQKSDLAKFNQICTDMSSKLQEMAKEQGDGHKSKMMTDLAAKFADVAQGGDITQLQPPARPSGPNSHHYPKNEEASLANVWTPQTKSHNNSHNPQAEGDLRELMQNLYSEVSKAAG